jgi:tungstate transport system substrate-binding protein
MAKQRIRQRRALAAALAGVLLSLLGAPFGTRAQERSIVVASTTSTQDSGLFDHILPLCKRRTGIDVKVIALGTGQALDMARRGDADVVFVHAKPQEEAFVAAGFGVERFDVMYNDFVLVGPAADPARVRGNDVLAALRAISATAQAFVSRGDASGTHAAELALWRSAGLDPAASKPRWYREIGQGMGATLNTASAMGAYTLSDRGTWISFKNKRDLTILVDGDRRLFNQYGIIMVNPAKHPHVRRELAQAFIDWVLAAEGQDAVRSYRIEGQQLFFPNAHHGCGHLRAGLARAATRLLAPCLLAPQRPLNTGLRFSMNARRPST